MLKSKSVAAGEETVKTERTVLRSVECEESWCECYMNFRDRFAIGISDQAGYGVNLCNQWN